MKRGAPLRTHKPLPRNTPLRQVSEKKATEDGNRFSTLDRKPAASRSVPMKRARYTGPDKATVDVVTTRSGGWCEFPGCLRQAVNRHHRDERGAGGRGPKAPTWINEPANLLDSCWPHNNWASNGSPEEARALGWLVPMGLATPYTVPVLTRHHPGKVLLDDKGCWVPVRGVAT